MKKILKYVGIGFIILIVIGAISSSGKSTNTTTSSSPSANSQDNASQPTSSKAKQWTTVFEANGSANKKTDVFTLQGGKAKITYDFEGGSYIVGSIYVVKEGHSIDEEGGFPEVTVTKAGSDSTFLVKQPGNYYLDVKAANTSWTIKIEEER